MIRSPRHPWLLATLMALTGVACSKRKDDGPGDAAAGNKDAADQRIAVDGSSTVYPITEAVAEEFKKTGKARVTIGVSGTGGGFKKFCKGETDVSGASRPIKQSEVEQCKSSGIESIELPVAFDGIAIAVHPDNAFVDHITVAELKTLWSPEAQNSVKKWNQVRAGWPDQEIHLFGAGVDSGTYDYFTEAIVGKEHASRGDFTSSEDDNVLVQGVSTDPSALAFIPFAYAHQNAAKLKLVPVDDGNPDNGAGPILPSVETIANTTYQPLARPIFIYVAVKAAERAEVQNFVDFYLTEGPKLVAEVGYVPLPAKGYELAKQRFHDRRTGSMFEGGAKVGVAIEDLLSKG